MNSTSGPTSSSSGQVLEMSKGLALCGLALVNLVCVVSVRALVLGTTDSEGEKSQTSSVCLKARWIVKEGKRQGKLEESEMEE